MGIFLRGPFDEAIALGHHWCGEEHVLLDLLAGGPILDLTHDLARDAIVTRLERDGAPFPDWAPRGCGSAPSYHEVLGRAIGFALGTGVAEPRSEHVGAALAWDPAGAMSGLLAGLGHARREVLDAVGPLGRFVPETPAPNPLPRPAEQEAVSLGHGFTGDEHLLLALVAGFPDDRAGRLLRAEGLQHDALSARVAHGYGSSDPPSTPPADPTKAPPSPRARQVFSAAEGLAATLGDGFVRSTDGLLGYLWQDDGQQLFAVESQGSSARAVIAALVETGVRVPAVPVPEPDRAPWGRWIPVPEDRVEEVVALVRQRHPSPPGRINCIGKAHKVLAKADIDLQAIVDEVLAIPRSEPPPA